MVYGFSSASMYLLDPSGFLEDGFASIGGEDFSYNKQYFVFLTSVQSCDGLINNCIIEKEGLTYQRRYFHAVYNGFHLFLFILI